MKKILGLLIIMVLVFAFVGCGNVANEISENEVLVEETETVVEETVVEEVASLYPMTIVDGMGREVTIESKPQSIVSLVPSTTEIIYAIGLGDKLVGRTDYCNYPEEALEVASIGSLREPSIEAIIALNPDIIVASTFLSEEVLVKFDEVGITVVLLSAQETFDGVYNIIAQAGKIFDVVDNSEAVIENMKAEVASTMAVIEGAEKKSVYYVVGYGEYGDYTATGDTFIHDMLEMGGGTNIAADGTGWSFNIETIIERNPEYIIVSENWDTKTLFESTEGYMELTAVKESKVMEIDQDLLSRQGPRLAQGLTAIAKILHPELFN